MAKYPGSNEPSGIAFGDLALGARVRFRRPGVQFPEDDGGYMHPLVIEGTVTYVNPRGEVVLKDTVLEGDDEADAYYRHNPDQIHLLEDGTFGEWFWEIKVLA